MTSAQRYSLRTLLLGISAMALLLAAIAQIRYQVKWGEHREMLTRWSAGLKRQPHQSEDFTLGKRNGRWLIVSTAEHEVAKDFADYTYDGKMPDPSRYFVIPPGKWVDTVDEIIATWEDYD